MFRTLWHRIFRRAEEPWRPPVTTKFLARPFRAELVFIHVANATATTGRRIAP